MPSGELPGLPDASDAAVAADSPGASRTPDVSVVVAVHDSARTLPALLAAMRAQDFDGTVELVVVDDGSRDESAGIARAGGARVIEQENAGPSAARNRGWREARAPVVLFTDSDCVPQADWVRRLAAAIGPISSWIFSGRNISSRVSPSCSWNSQRRFGSFTQI